MNKAEWFKCSEGLPTESGNYLLCADGYVFEVGFYVGDNCFTCPLTAAYMYFDMNITHWTHLPEPPETD